jgi:predicted phage tail protein
MAQQGHDQGAATGGDDNPTTLMGSTSDLADEQPRSRTDKILQWVPRLLSSKPHVLLLLCLGIYLIVLPLAGVAVSSNAELIGGNYTNVTSDIGACIAAGGTLKLISQSRKRGKVEEERLRLARETHRLLHYVHSDAARELGHLVTGAPPPRGSDQ